MVHAGINYNSTSSEQKFGGANYNTNSSMMPGEPNPQMMYIQQMQAMQMNMMQSMKGNMTQE